MHKTCVFIILSLLMAACGTDATPSPTATNTLTPTRTPRTFDADMVAQTLPASWTPTFTPTVTDTPTVTLTPTASDTPTVILTPTPLDLDKLCDDFEFIYEADEDTVYGPDDLILMSYGLNYPDTAIEFTAIFTETGEEIYFITPGGSLYKFEFEPKKFPGSGTYTWTVTVLADGKGGLCEQSGTWIIEGVVPTPTPRTLLASSPVPSRTPGPEITAEVTAELTDEAQPDTPTTPSATPRTIFASSPVPAEPSAAP